MTDDIVTRLREYALEGIWDLTATSFDLQTAADEIERLRKICDQLAEALEIQVQTNRVPATTRAHYSQHAITALAAWGIEVRNELGTEPEL